LELRHGRLVWIAAPAGAGKTTLAALYATAHRRRTLWYQIDARDTDPATFFYYLREAAARVTPRARRTLSLLTAEYALGLGTYARNFFEQLGQILKPPVALIFDNYHELPDDAALHALVAEGMRALPPALNTFILSRKEPPPAYAALRADRRLGLLDAELLALTPAETRTLARRYRFKRLTSEAVTNLHERTRGWTAGVILMLEEATRARGTAPQFSEPVPHAMFDYFATEVLQRAPAPQQKVLLKTAPLRQVSVEAARALAGEDQAARILAELAGRGYFVYALAGREATYQFHPLFRDFLLARLREERSPQELASLHRRAAGYAEASGDPEEALRLWRDAGAWAEMSRLLVDMTPGMLEQGRGAALAAWIERVPVAVRERDAWMQFSLAQARLPENLAQARSLFEAAYALFETAADRAGVLLAAAGVVDSIVLEFGDLRRLDPWIERLEETLGPNPRFPDPTIGLRVTSSMAVALLFRRERREDVTAWITRATKLLPLIPHLAARSRLAVYLSLDATWTGDLARVDRFARNIAIWSRALHGGESDRLEAQYAKYVQTLYEWIGGTSDCGKTAALEALAFVESSGIHVMEHHLVARAVFGALCTGELAFASELLDRLRVLAARSRSGRLDMYQYHYLPGWLALLSGDFEAALHHAENSLRIAREAATPVFHQAFDAMVAAYALLALKRATEAASYIDMILQTARHLESPIIEFSGLLLLADAELFSGGEVNEARSLETLARALSIGRTHGYRNTLVWFPAAMGRCCARALLHDMEVDYAKMLVCSRGLRLPPDVSRPERWPWPLRIYTLGEFRILRADDVAPPLQRKPRDLLQALIALGAREVGIGALQQALWPDSEGDMRAIMDTNLYRLRSVLGEAAVVIKNGRVSLDRDHCWVDVWAFEQLVVSLDAALAQPASSASLSVNAETFLRLYRGPFLGQELDAIWAVGPRERLRSRFLRIVTALAASYERTGRYPEAMVCAQRALEADPLAEGCYRALMRCHLAQGERAAAMSVYHRCHDVLRSVLGLAPAAETEALRRQTEGDVK